MYYSFQFSGLELELDLADAAINLLFKSQIMKTCLELRRLVCAS
jgi:hypothetical protein